jgi:hypothetical protein
VKRLPGYDAWLAPREHAPSAYCACGGEREPDGSCRACAADEREEADALAAHEPWSPADLDARSELLFVAEMTHSRAAASAQESA